MTFKELPKKILGAQVSIKGDPGGFQPKNQLATSQTLLGACWGLTGLPQPAESCISKYKANIQTQVWFGIKICKIVVSLQTLLQIRTVN